MVSEFNSNWNKSISPRKQRKYLANAPSHIKSKMLGAHLSEDLRKKYGTRSTRIRKGDKVEVKRGQFKGKNGKVERVDIKHGKIYVAGVELQKVDGTKVFYPVSASNVEILDLNLQDKARTELLKRK